MTGEHPKADPQSSNPVDIAMIAELKRLSTQYSGYVGDQLGNAALRLGGLIEEIKRLRGTLFEAQQALLREGIRTGDIELERDRLRVALEKIEALEHTKQSDYKKSLESWAIAKDALESCAHETSGRPYDSSGTLREDWPLKPDGTPEETAVRCINYPCCLPTGHTGPCSSSSEKTGDEQS